MAFRPVAKKLPLTKIRPILLQTTNRMDPVHVPPVILIQIPYIIMNCFRTTLLLAVLFISGIVTPHLTGDDVHERIRELHDRYRIDRDKAGIYFVTLDSGRAIYRQNQTSAFVPASNMKLVTAFVALKRLGPDAVFKTELFVSQNDHGQKHLYVGGGGDPTISRHANDSHTAVFENWADQLKAQGHDSFSGNLYLDHSAYERQITHPTWSEYKHSFWYTAPVDALNYNDNCVLLTVLPQSPGRPARVKVEPEGAPVKIRNKTETVRNKSRSHIKFHRTKDTWTINVSGGIRPKTARKEWITVPYPTTYFGSVLQTVFKGEQIPIQGKTRIKPIPDHLAQTDPVVQRTTPLSRTLDRMLKESQNLFAETILKQVAYQETGKGSWSEASKIVRNTLKNEGISTARCAFIDGSGLSRSNLLTPRCLVSVLRTWIRSPSIDEHISSLPVSDVDGTMEHRLNNPPYQKDVAAKTGTLSGVKALSGIAGRKHLNDNDGRVILFSIIVNQEDLPPGNARVFVDHVARVAHDLVDSSE